MGDLVWGNSVWELRLQRSDLDLGMGSLIWGTWARENIVWSFCLELSLGSSISGLSLGFTLGNSRNPI